MSSIYNTTLLPNETEYAYLWRLGRAKDSGLLEMNWDGIADLMNKNFRENDMEFAESAYRKVYTSAKKVYESGVFGTDDENKEASDLKEIRNSIIKERQKLMDERREFRANLRNEARYDYDMSVLSEKLIELGREKYAGIAAQPIICDHKDMVIMVSDTHFGSQYNYFDGYYDTDVAKSRMEEYCRKAITLAKDKGVETCYVVVLGDLISGQCHNSIAVTNRENVIEQVKIACEVLTDFVYNLATELKYVEVHCVPGNHSRIQKKADALTDERLDLIIPWFMSRMLCDVENVCVCDEEMDSTICTFRVHDKLYVGVHGDYDGMNEVAIQKLIMWLGEIPYCVMMGHRHFNAVTTVSDVKVVQGGALGGAGDNFTREKRLKGRGEQMMMICEDGEITEYHPVRF